MPGPCRHRSRLFPSWLKTQRKAHGESTEDVARLIGRSDSTVRAWESGRLPKTADDVSVTVLERHWESIAPKTEMPVDLATALMEQARVIQAQVDAIDRQTAMLERLLERLTDPDARQRELESVTDVQEFRVLEKLEQVAKLLRGQEIRPESPKER